MHGFRSHIPGRLGLAAILFTAAAGVSLAVAPAAGAAPAIQPCQPAQGGTFVGATSITVSDTVSCPPFLFKKNVSIWQFSPSNTWVEVASGTGTTTYNCKGTTLRLHYETRTVDFGNKDFYDNCN